MKQCMKKVLFQCCLKKGRECRVLADAKRENALREIAQTSVTCSCQLLLGASMIGA